MIKANKLTKRKIIGVLIATIMILNNLSVFTFAQSTNSDVGSSINEIVQDNNTIEIISEGSTEASSEETTEVSSEETTEVSSEETTEASSEGSTEVSSEGSTEVSSEGSTEVSSEGSTEVSSEGSTEEVSEDNGSLKFGEDYFYEDLNIEVGNTNFKLIEGIKYDKEKYILAVEHQGGFDINTIGTYTVEYALISYSTKEVVANFTRTVNVVERTNSKVKFDLPPLKIEKGTQDYNLLENATAYTYNNEELKLYIKDLRDFNVDKMGIYTILFGVESDSEEYANEEAERKIIVFGTDEDLTIAENKYNVKTVTGEIISYNTLKEALKYEADLEENLEIILSGEYTFTKDSILALSSNEKKLIIKGKGIATIKAKDNLSFTSEYTKLENLHIEFSNDLPEITTSSTILELIDIAFGENLPTINSTNSMGILTIKNGAYEEIKSEKGIVYLIGENVTINSKIYGFKSLKLGGNEEKLILNVGKIETDIETEEGVDNYKFTYDEIEKELKDSIGTVKLSVDLNSDENKIEEETIIGEVSLEGNAVLILNENGSIINKLTSKSENNLIMVHESDETDVPIIIRKAIDTTRNIKIGILNVQELLKTSEGVEELNKQIDEGKKYPVIKYEMKDGDVFELLKNITSFDYANEEDKNYEKFEFALLADEKNNIIYQTFEKNLLSEYLYIMRFKDEFFKKGTVNRDYTLDELKTAYLEKTADVINKESYDSSWTFTDAINDFMNKYKFNGNDAKGNNNLIILINENKFENKDDKNTKTAEKNITFDYIDNKAIEKLTQFGSEISFDEKIDSPRIVIAGTKGVNNGDLSAKIKFLIGNEKNKKDDYIFHMNADLILKNIGVLTPYDESEVTFYMGRHNFIANEGASVTPILSKDELEIYNSIIDGSYENALSDLINSDMKRLLDQSKGISIVSGTDNDKENSYKDENSEITIETDRYFNAINIIGGTIYGDIANSTININGEKTEISKIYAGNLGNGDSSATINVYNGKIGTLYSGNVGNGDANINLNIAGGKFVNLYTGNTEVVEDKAAMFRMDDLEENESTSKVTLEQNHNINLASYKKIAGQYTRGAKASGNISINSKYTGGSFENLILNYNTISDTNYRFRNNNEKSIGFELNNVNVENLYFENEEDIKDLTVNLDIENVNFENLYINNVGGGNVENLTLTFNYENPDGINIKKMTGGYAGGIGEEHGTYKNLTVNNGTAEEFTVYNYNYDKFTNLGRGGDFDVPHTKYTMNGGDYDNVYCHNYTTTIQNSRITNLYGYVKNNSGYPGILEPTTNIIIESGTISNIYGGSEMVRLSPGFNPIKVSTNIKIYGGTIGNIYGGNKYGYQDSVTRTLIIVQGTTINGDIYGGNETNTSDTTINKTSIEVSDSRVNGNIYGVNKENHYMTTVNDEALIIINNSKIKGSIFGGGNQSSAPLVIKKVRILLQYPIGMNGPGDPNSAKNIYGGSYNNNSYDNIENVEMVIKGVKQSIITPFGGGIKNIYGGSSRSKYDENNYIKNVSITVDDCNGGSDNSNIQDKAIGNIYGGHENRSGGNADIGNVTITINGSLVGNVYGGNSEYERADVDGNTQNGGSHGTGNVKGNVKINTNYSNIGGNIYGGNGGFENVKTGNTSVTINGGNIHSTEIFGGNKGGRGPNSQQGYADEAGYIEGSSSVTIIGGNFPNLEKIGGGNGHSNKNGYIGGSSSVTFNGGSFPKLTTIYGGNGNGNSTNNGNIGENSSVTITGGDFPKVTTIYGGNGKSGGNVIGNSSVTITGGTFPKVTTIYGGGDHTGQITGSTSVNISGGTFSAIQNIYGGNMNGAVRETSSVQIENASLKNTSSTDFTGIYGGNATDGDVGSGNSGNGSSVTILSTDLNPQKIFGGNAGNGSVRGNSSVKLDNAYVIIKNPAIYGIYGGNNGVGDVTGSTSVTINGNGEICSEEIFGGNKGGKDPSSNFIKAGYVGGSSSVNIEGGAFQNLERIRGGNGNDTKNGNIEGDSSVRIANGRFLNLTTIYGGNQKDGTVVGNSSVNIEGGRFGNLETIYGGGDHDDGITGSTSVNISGGNFSTASGGSLNLNIYGGNMYGAVKNTSSVQIKNASLKFNNTDFTGIYGGNGPNTNKNVGSGNSGDGSFVIISGGTLNPPKIYGGNAGNGQINGNSKVEIDISGDLNELQKIFGGNVGNGDVTGTSSVSIKGNATIGNQSKPVNIGGGNAKGNNVGKDSIVSIEGGTFPGVKEIYGGNNGNNRSASVGGSSKVIIKGGTFNDLVSIYGGNYGNGNVGTTVTESTSSVEITNGQFPILANIYGGNRGSGNVGGNSKVEIKGGTFSDKLVNVYGGNANGGNVGKDSSVIISPETGTLNQTFDGIKTIHGGNANGGNVGKDSSVIINATGFRNLKTIYGGNNGNSGNVGGNSSVTIKNGAFDSLTDIYAGNKDTGNGTVKGNTSVTIEGGTFKVLQNIYGGDVGDKNVEGNTSVTIEGGTFNRLQNIYGGNRGSGNVGGSSSVNISGTSNVTVNNGNIYGGNAGTGNVGENSTVNIKNVTGNISNVYGGNAGSGTINNNVEITINAASIGSIYGGRNPENDNTGETIINVFNSYTSNPTSIDSIDGGTTDYGNNKVKLQLPERTSINGNDGKVPTIKTPGFYGNNPTTINKYITRVNDLTIGENNVLVIKGEGSISTTPDEISLKNLTLGSNAAFIYEKSYSNISNIRVTNLNFGDGATIGLPDKSISNTVYTPKTLEITNLNTVTREQAGQNNPSYVLRAYGTGNDTNKLRLYLVGVAGKDIATGRDNSVIKFVEKEDQSYAFNDQSMFNKFITNIVELNTSDELKSKGIDISITGNAIPSNSGDSSRYPVIYFGYDTALSVSIPTKLLFIGITDMYNGIDSPVYTIENNSEVFKLKVEVVGFEEAGTTNGFKVDNGENYSGNDLIELKINGTEDGQFPKKPEKDLPLLPTLNENNPQELGTLMNKSKNSNKNFGKFVITGNTDKFKLEGENIIKRGSFKTIFRFTPLDENDNKVPSSNLAN